MPFRPETGFRMVLKPGFSSGQKLVCAAWLHFHNFLIHNKTRFLMGYTCKQETGFCCASEYGRRSAFAALRHPCRRKTRFQEHEDWHAPCIVSGKPNDKLSFKYYDIECLDRMQNEDTDSQGGIINAEANPIDTGCDLRELARLS
jgi:hypothetical protein